MNKIIGLLIIIFTTMPCIITFTARVAAAAPAIIVQPKGGKICEGIDITLSVEADIKNVVYQWFLNGDYLWGANNKTYTISNAQKSNSGIYTVIVTGNDGETTSEPAQINVLSPPVITSSNLADKSICEGSSLNLQVTATGDELNYQWYLSNEAIPGATIPTYTINNATKLNDYGTYQLKIHNVACSSEAISPEARIWVAQKISRPYLIEVPAVANVGERTRLHVGYDYGYADVTKYSWVFSSPNNDLNGITPSNSTVYVTFNNESEMQLITVAMSHVCDEYIAFDVIKVKRPTDIESYQSDREINVYPNPASEELSVRSDKLKIESIVINDINGKIIYENNSASDNHSFIIANWPRGIYLVKIKTAEGISVHKILKQ